MTPQQRNLERALAAWRSHRRDAENNRAPLGKCHEKVLAKLLTSAVAYARLKPAAKVFRYCGRIFRLERTGDWLFLRDWHHNLVAGPVRLDGGAAWEA